MNIIPMTSLTRNGVDLTGRKFGRLTVVSLAGRHDSGFMAWNCACDCGRASVGISSVLKRGLKRSCGCLSREAGAARRRLSGPWVESKSNASKSGVKCYKTRHAWAKAVIRHYGNKCDICGWDKARCDAHHRIPKARGGMHTIANGQVLCPNCHRVETENK